LTTSERMDVEPAVLRWARQTAGFDLPLAARRLQVKPEVIARWEEGLASPTIVQLRKAAAVYKRPLAVLLLPAPIRDPAPPTDFRVTEQRGEDTWTPALHAEFRRALSQRAVALEILDVWPESLFPSEYPIRIDLNTDPDTAAHAIRAALDADGWRPEVLSRPGELLSTTIEAVERLGVLVIQTERVESSEMQGFSISERPYPLIALNGKDYHRRRLFTLLHELCHISLNVGGVCDPLDNLNHRESADEIEIYCNQVAAAILMPRQRMLDNPLVRSANTDHRWNLEELGQLSQQFGASSQAVLLRLINLGRATWQLYDLRRFELEREYERHRQQEEDRRKKSKGGPNYYSLKVRNLGHGYVSAVLRAYRNQAISSRDVAAYLGVRFDQLEQMERRVS